MSVINPTIVLLVLGITLIAVAKLQIYSDLLHYLYSYFQPNFISLAVFPGNLSELAYLFRIDLIVFLLLLSSYLLLRTLFASGLTDMFFLVISGAYAFLAFANQKWVAESGMLLDFGTLMFGFHQFSDALLVIKEYASRSLLLGICLVLVCCAFYFYRDRLVSKPPLQKGERAIISIVFFVAIFTVFTYDAARAEQAARMHSQLIRNAPSVHLQIIREAAAAFTKDKGSLVTNESKKDPGEIDHLQKTPNIVLIGLESTRFKSTPFATAEGITDVAEMPYLAEIARNGVLIKNVHTSLPRTSKSLASALSGKTPVVSSYLAETELNYPLAGLPDYLKKFGYQSAYFQSPIGNFERRPALIHNLGFDRFLTVPEIHPDTEIIGYLNADDRLMVDPAITWAEQQESPFLLTLFTSITHHPYMLPGEYDVDLWQKFKTTMSAEEKYQLYKKSLTYSDGFIKAVIEGLEAKGLMKNTIVVIFGDHGEGFGEKGILAHSQNPYEEVLRIPLIFYGKDYFAAGQVVEGFYSNMDIVPTILSKMGAQPMPADIEGVNIFDAKKPNRKLFFSVWFDRSLGGMIDEEGRKFIFDPVSESFEVYDLTSDPWEKKNLFGQMHLQGFDFDPIREEIVAWKVGHYDQGYDTDENEIKKFSEWHCKATGNGFCYLGSEPPKQLYIGEVD